MTDCSTAEPGLKRQHLAVAFVVVMIVWLVIVVAGWVSEDAFITLRAVDNFANGYGPRWNVHERVQVFTHPLWFLILSGAYAVTREPYLTTLALQLVISAAALWLLLTRLARTPLAVVIGGVLLVSSNAFIDYSTSGLENPLSHLLLVVFLVIAWTGDPDSASRPFWLALVAGLAVMNRTDTGAVYAPIMAYELWIAYRGGRFWRSFGAMALGFVPLVGWHVFSVIYYGFPFPNTAYAKLNTGIPSWRLALHGLAYTFDLVRYDLPSALTLLLGLTIPLADRKHRTPREIAILIGLLLYVLYMFRIGGDFMAGRFFALPFVGAVALLLRTDLAPMLPSRIELPEWTAVMLLGPLALFGLWRGAAVVPVVSVAYNFPFRSYDFYHEAGIADEQGYYYGCAGVLNYPLRDQFPDCSWWQQGVMTRDTGDTFVLVPWIGFFGYAAGPDVTILDPLALSDVFLARLPVIGGYRIGHFGRQIPAGYVETIQTGENRIEDPGLGALYEDVVLVTRAPLFAEGRWAAIWRLNTGYHDAAIEAWAEGVRAESGE